MSGGDRHLLEMAAHWRGQVELGILAPKGFQTVAERFLPGVPTASLGSIGDRRRGAGPFLALEYLRRSAGTLAVALPRADVVLAASHFLPDAAGLAAGARRGAYGVAYVYHLVSGRRARDARTLWSTTDEHLALNVLRRRAGLVFASNRATAQALRERGLHPVRTNVGLDVAAFSAGGVLARPRRAIFLARMVRTKGVLDALEAWARIAPRVPDAELLMVGDGPQQEAAVSRAGALGLSGVRFTGFVSEEEKRTMLAESRVLLAPSYEEGWGITVAEALASGVPVVAYRLPALDELFPAAYLGAAPGDVETLAGLAAHVLSDDAQAEELSRAGRRAVRPYDAQTVAEHELALILKRLHSS